MKTIWKAAVAAVAIVAGAGQAQAVRWVEYTITGTGTTTTESPTLGAPIVTTVEGAFLARFTVDVDPGFGQFGNVLYGSDGTTYSAINAATRYEATFSPTSIVGSVALNIDRARFTFTSDFTDTSRAMRFSGVGSGPFGGITTTATGTALQLTVNEVSEGRVFEFVLPGTSTEVPEPATWGLMILGFGAIGAAVRVRRRTASITFA